MCGWDSQGKDGRQCLPMTGQCVLQNPQVVKTQCENFGNVHQSCLKVQTWDSGAFQWTVDSLHRLTSENMQNQEKTQNTGHTNRSLVGLQGMLLSHRACVQDKIPYLIPQHCSISPHTQHSTHAHTHTHTHRHAHAHTHHTTAQNAHHTTVPHTHTHTHTHTIPQHITYTNTPYTHTHSTSHYSIPHTHTTSQHTTYTYKHTTHTYTYNTPHMHTYTYHISHLLSLTHTHIIPHTMHILTQDKI